MRSLAKKTLGSARAAERSTKRTVRGPATPYVGGLLRRVGRRDRGGPLVEVVSGPLYGATADTEAVSIPDGGLASFLAAAAPGAPAKMVVSLP